MSSDADSANPPIVAVPRQVNAVRENAFPVWILLIGAAVIGTIICSGMTLIAMMYVTEVPSPRESDGYHYYPNGYLGGRRAARNLPVNSAFGPGRPFNACNPLPPGDARLWLPCAVWTGPNSFAVLDEKGVVSRIQRLPGSMAFQFQHVAFGKRGVWLCMSRKDLVAIFEDDTSLHFLNETSLENRFEIELSWQPGRVASCQGPGRDHVIAVSQDQKKLAVADVVAGRVIATYDLAEFRGAGFESLLATPDGKYLLTQNQRGGVARFHVAEDGLLTLDEVSSSPPTRPASRIVSVDARSQLAVQSWHDRINVPGRLAVEPAFGFDVFRIGELRTGLLEFGGYDVTAAAFDPLSPSVCVGTRYGELLQFSTDPIQRWQVPTKLWRDANLLPPDGRQAIRQLAMNRGGDMLLVMLERELIVLAVPPQVVPGLPAPPPRR